MTQRVGIQFRDGDDVLSLWPEKTLPMDDGTEYVLGWCPERKNNMVVHPANIIHASPHGNPKGGPAPTLPLPARDTQEDTP